LALLVASAADGKRPINANVMKSPMNMQLISQMGRLEAEPKTPFTTGILSFLKGLMSGEIKTAVYVKADNVNSALSGLADKSMMVVIEGDWISQDHTGQNFVSVDEKSKLANIKPYLTYMNTMSALLEKVSPQPLIPFTLSTFPRSSNVIAADTYVVFDLINGYLYLREDIASSLDNVSEQDLHGSYRKFTAHVEAKAAEHGDAKFEHPVDMFNAWGLPLSHLLLNPWVACTVCMVALVFLFPLAANYILINLALYVCTALNLTNTTCTALWASAAALVFVSMPLMAYAIFTVCGLYQCSHQTAAALL